MKPNLSDKLEKCYWRLALHVDKAIHGEVGLDSPTIPETKILTSTDPLYKELAPDLDKLAYHIVAHEKKCLADLERDIEALVSLGADKTRKSGVVKDFFKNNLERYANERNSSSYCPACKNIRYPNDTPREKCKQHPGKEYITYNCPDFKDVQVMNWDVHHSQIDQSIKITKSVLNELGEHEDISHVDIRTKRAVDKYVNKLK